MCRFADFWDFRYTFFHKCGIHIAKSNFSFICENTFFHKSNVANDANCIKNILNLRILNGFFVKSYPILILTANSFEKHFIWKCTTYIRGTTVNCNRRCKHSCFIFMNEWIHSNKAVVMADTDIAWISLAFSKSKIILSRVKSLYRIA